MDVGVDDEMSNVNPFRPEFTSQDLGECTLTEFSNGKVQVPGTSDER